MRLLYTPYNLNLEMPSESVTTLVVENRVAYRELASDLYRQSEGLEGTAVFSQGNKELKMSSEVNVVMNPFEINFNTSRMKARLVKEIASIGKEDFYQNWIAGIGPLIEYVENVIQTAPYSITYDADPSIEDVLKMLDVRLDYEASELSERICDYIQIMSSLMGIKLLILVTPSLYFSRQELAGVYEKAVLNKLTVLAIETSTQDVDGLEYVLDQDLCLIRTVSENLQHVPACRFGENLEEFEV